MIEITQQEGVTCVKGIIEIAGQSSIVYVYHVDQMLIDTGPQSLEDELTAYLQDLSFDQVVLTHSHEDHVGCAAWIQEQMGVPISILEKGVRACSHLERYPEYRRIVWGERREFTAQPFVSNQIKSAHDTWHVIETPGHADDHVAFWNKETGQLFSGDLFLTVRPKVFLRFESISTIMQSIRDVLGYDFQSLFCSHAGYIPDGRQKLQQKLQGLEEISGAILQLHSKGYTIEAITKELFPHTPPIVYFSKGEFDTKHIVRSVVEEMGTMAT